MSDTKNKAAAKATSGGASHLLVAPLSTIVTNDSLVAITMLVKEHEQHNMVSKSSEMLPAIRSHLSRSVDVLLTLDVPPTLANFLLDAYDEGNFAGNIEIISEGEVEDDDEKEAEAVSDGTLLVRINEAAAVELNVTETDIRSHPKFLALYNLSDRNAESLDSALDRLGRLLTEINKDEPMVDLVEADDSMTNAPNLNPGSASAMQATLRTAGSAAQRESEHRRYEQQLAYNERLEKLRTTVFKSGEPKLVPIDVRSDSYEEISVLVEKALFNVIVNTSFD